MFNPFQLKENEGNKKTENIINQNVNQAAINENIQPRNNNGVNGPKINNNGVNGPKINNNGTNGPKINNNGENVVKNELAINTKYIKGNYSDKHHYFIGSIIQRNDIKELQNIQRLLKNPLFKNPRWSLPFHTRYVYLGYVDSSVAVEMMNRIFHPLCLAIAEKYGKLHCTYEKIKYRSKYSKASKSLNANNQKDSGIKIISAEYKDDGNILNNIIIPYLKKEGLKKVYSVESKPEKPHIDLLYGNCNMATYHQIRKSAPTIRFSPKGFEINHLCLIKGTSYDHKSRSKYDRLNIETVREFYYPLHGTTE
jgi:hypothetical protein